MTPPHDTDLQQLDQYLDDALSPDESETLRARLQTDEQLRDALSHLREERTLRRAFFTTLEPDDATVAAFTTRLHRAAAHAQPTRLLRPLRYTAAAAALIAIGFFTHGLLDHRPTTPADNTLTQVAQKKGIDLQKVETYEVTLRDDAGRVVAVQRFDSIDKAQEFAADLSRWQSRNERLAGSRFVVTADRF